MNTLNIMTMNKKEYTYWIFYLKNPDKYDHPLESNYSNIYAYTTDKKLSDNFQRERNMSCFKMSKKKLNKESVCWLAREIPKSKLFIYKAETKNHEIENRIVELTITTTEKCLVTWYCYNAISQKMWEHVTFNPYTFKNKYIQSLIAVKYVECFELLSNLQVSYISSPLISEIRPDFVSGFIHIYADLLKK